ncbi:hypothetical protein CNMCM5623_007182 [Aspergillus felis]|uniref:Uncharacterized protein n=1 Tax=Aspergillus felis TaxID=1287682 RepID=A0A8H6UQA1_9EURO|nr:hypothetical protein CNMCM5623_007182 [Aspergillus felis]KAF7179331.1 hypothetical protein CNMCM7691_008264 [Aspergillus felis]
MTVLVVPKNPSNLPWQSGSHSPEQGGGATAQTLREATTTDTPQNQRKSPSNPGKKSGPRLAHRKSRNGCQRCRARRVKSVMKRVQYAETVIDMGSPVSMTGRKAKVLALKPNRNAAPLPLPSRGWHWLAVTKLPRLVPPQHHAVAYSGKVDIKRTRSSVFCITSPSELASPSLEPIFRVLKTAGQSRFPNWPLSINRSSLTRPSYIRGKCAELDINITIIWLAPNLGRDLCDKALENFMVEDMS